MKKLNFKILCFSIFFCACKTTIQLPSNHQSETLKIQKLSPNTFVHTTFLQTKNFGNVPCNGMIVIDNGEAVIFDTPTTDSVSNELINFVEKQLNSTIKGIVVTHFHIDCLGGLKAFHNKNIPSYSNQLTIDLAKSQNEILPQNGFDNSLELKVGQQKVICDYLGEGHTKDNIVAYFSKDKTLFGGCLIKAEGAGKGNLSDANVQEWSSTVQKVKSRYPDVKKVIPGHGKSGGINLLDFTIALFK